MISECDMDAEQNDRQEAPGGNPRMASILSVWEDANSLSRFVWDTVRARACRRRAEWFDPEAGGNLVTWSVPHGYRPTVEESMARHVYRAAHGDTGLAFGWSHLKIAPSGPTRPAANAKVEGAHV